jgi:3-phenylpropionate/trans-cinnamate dioxygenase ferredoxin component
MSKFIEVAKKSQIPEAGAIGVVAGGTAIALVKLEDEVYALQDTCPHEAGPLSEGEVIGEEIECPWHRSCFNVKTGRVTRDPATENVATFKVRIAGDAVEVEVQV